MPFTSRNSLDFSEISNKSFFLWFLYNTASSFAVVQKGFKLENMLSVEEEAFTLEILDALEKNRVEKRIFNCINTLINTGDTKEIVKRLRNYIKEINKNNPDPITHSNLYKQKDYFECLIEDLICLGKVFGWDNAFIEILKNYLSTRNLSLSLNMMTTYNEINEISIELQNH